MKKVLHQTFLWIPSTLLLVLILAGSREVSTPTSDISHSQPPELAIDDWENALKASFRKEYQAVTQAHAKNMHASYPVITQDLLNMTLIRSNGEKIRFRMDRKAYMTFAHATHPPLTIYSMLYQEDFELKDSTLQKLQAYRELLAAGKKGVWQTSHINAEQQQRIHDLLSRSDEFLQRIVNDQQTSKAQYHAYAKSIRPLLAANLYDGAMEQLTQFRVQLEEWKQAYPEENWDELRVVILGFHQPRDLYVTKTFFQWLLEESGFEKQVVYAEFQGRITGKYRENAEHQALELLTKIDLEKEASLFLLGNENQLQQDVMGPAAVEIMKAWGRSTW